MGRRRMTRAVEEPHVGPQPTDCDRFARLSGASADAGGTGEDTDAILRPWRVAVRIMRPSPRVGVRAADSWLGHPKGVYLVAFTELWERFSYFGMTALMVLFLTGDPADGGWGWARNDAILFFSFYTGLVFVVPVVGAWLANNYLGERKCIVVGAMLLVTGHLLLGGLAFVPLLIKMITVQDAVALIEASGFPQGRLWALDDAI